MPGSRFSRLALELMPLGIVVLLAAGCSTLDVDGAKALGKAGQDAAQATLQSVLPVGGRIDRYTNELVFVAALRGVPGLDENARRSLDAIGQTIDARRVVFERLSAAYGAFEDLAVYDAAGAVTGALGDLGSAVNAYGAAAGGSSPVINDGTVDLASTVGGLIADEVKKRRILKASTVLRSQVEKLRDFMKTGTERQAVAAFDDELAREDLLVARRLWEMNRVDAGPLVADMVAPSGLKLIGAPLTATDPQLAAGIKALFAERRGHLSSDAADSYDTSVAALDELIRQHNTLEAGAPVDISSIAARAATLRQIADKLTKAVQP